MDAFACLVASRLSRRCPMGWLVFGTLVMLAAPTASYAGMSVRGTADDLRIIAEQAPLDRLLSAISAKFPVRYQTAVPLNETITGSYAGSPEQVTRRLLAGYNYFIKSRGQVIEFFVLSRHDRPDQTSRSLSAAHVITAPPASNAVAADAMSRRERH